MPLNFYTGLSLPFEPQLEKLSAEQRERFDRFSDGKMIEHAVDELNARTPGAVDRGWAGYEEPDKFTLLRFLQADDYDLEKATTRLVGTMQWRQQMGLDVLLKNPPAALEVYRRYRVRLPVGFDHTGRPVVVERTGIAVGTENHLCLPWEEFLSCMLYDAERMTMTIRETSARLGVPVQRIVLISDLSGMNMTLAFRNLSFLRRLLSVIPLHYPEMAGKMFIVNAPWYIGKGWAIVSTFLDKKTAAAVSITQGLPVEELRTIMDPSVLPREFGGENDVEIPKAELYKPR